VRLRRRRAGPRRRVPARLRRPVRMTPTTGRPRPLRRPVQALSRVRPTEHRDLMTGPSQRAHREGAPHSGTAGMNNDPHAWPAFIVSSGLPEEPPILRSLPKPIFELAVQSTEGPGPSLDLDLSRWGYFPLLGHAGVGVPSSGSTGDVPPAEGPTSSWTARTRASVALLAAFAPSDYRRSFSRFGSPQRAQQFTLERRVNLPQCSQRPRSRTGLNRGFVGRVSVAVVR
jgi:hypothetical protein